MKKFGLIFGLLALGGCADLSPQQQANLQLQLKVGETWLKAAQNLYCVIEPTAGKLVAIYDTSEGTRVAIEKADSAQKLLCQQAIGAS